jgi:hypothetical protein
MWRFRDLHQWILKTSCRRLFTMIGSARDGRSALLLHYTLQPWRRAANVLTCLEVLLLPNNVPHELARNIEFWFKSSLVIIRVIVDPCSSEFGRGDANASTYHCHGAKLLSCGSLLRPQASGTRTPMVFKQWSSILILSWTSCSRLVRTTWLAAAQSPDYRCGCHFRGDGDENGI